MMPTLNGPRGVGASSRAVALLAGVAVFTAGLLSEAESTAAQKSASLDQRIAGHLQAGEFGLALSSAKQAEPARQQQLFKTIAEAAATAGEYAAVRSASAAIAEPAARSRVQRNAARRQLLGSGGMMANFQPLIQLIQDNTGDEEIGPWLDITGEGGTISGFPLGVRADPSTLLDRTTRTDRSGRLNDLGAKVRKAALNDDMARASSLRLVSLPRLERAVAERIGAGEPALETMQQLAGLTRIQYVFISPDDHEVIVAGPAEGWKYDEDGRPLGLQSNRPTLHLDDLVELLRTFSPAGPQVFGCSINPRPENLKSVKEFVEASQAQGPLGPGRRNEWLKGILDRMGLQDVEVFGVTADTRLARTLVEADYRMKLIGIGKLDGGKGIPGIFDLLPLAQQKDAPPLNALRWWMTMKCDAIVHSPDRQVFELQGSSVLVLSEDQVVKDNGERVQTGQASSVNQMFAKNFTGHYAELAMRDPVFADLQNVFDLGLVAALLNRELLAQRAGWDLGVFAPEGDYRVTPVKAPKEVHSVINHRLYRGRDIVVQVAGGVRADLLAIAEDQGLARESSVLKQLPAKSKPVDLPVGRWWWDADAPR